jgi:hypothetical protein
VREITNPGENASHKQAGAWTTQDDNGKIAEVTKMKWQRRTDGSVGMHHLGERAKR